MILISTLSIMCYCIIYLVQDGPVNDGFIAFNESKFWNMIGFSFYTFEGIGTILPIMKESQNPTHFPRILQTGFLCLSGFFTLFGLVSYKYFGN